MRNYLEMKRITRRENMNNRIKTIVFAVLGVFFVAAVGLKLGAIDGLSFGPALQDVIKARGLTADDIEAALKTYVPPGSYDEYLLFASGGQAGNVEVFGVPSMRLLKNIAIFSPDSWQGPGVGDDDTKRLMKQGEAAGMKQTWGDAHHPALSLTKGMYDGQYLFANDKANARIGVGDLRDFKVRQIVKNPLIATNPR